MTGMDGLIGNTYGGSVYRDGWRLVQAESTNTTAVLPAGFVLKATIDAALAAARAYRAGDLVNGSANGYIELGAGDGVELVFLGTDAANETVNYLLSVIHPVFDPADDNPKEPACYLETGAAAGAATLGTLTAGAVGALITGIDATDLIADAVTITTAQIGAEAYAPADNSVAHLSVTVEGAQAVRIQTDRGTAASGLVIGRRIVGGAQRQ